MALYGRGRGGVFGMDTPRMRALRMGRAREQSGAHRPVPTDAERLAKGEELAARRERKTLAGKKTYQPK